MSNAPTTPDVPQGLALRREVILPEQERELLARFEELRWREIHAGDDAAPRAARHFGLGYDYERHVTHEDEPIPSWLEPYRDVAARLAGAESGEVVEVLLQRYPAGATIDWHRDAPAYGIVIGISLLAPAVLRMRAARKPRQVLEIDLEPRSGYVFAGESRDSWEHSIPPTSELRYSITFRTFREDWERIRNEQRTGALSAG